MRFIINLTFSDCKTCETLDTTRFWKSKKEFCPKCNKDMMDRAPPGTYEVFPGWYEGCHQNEDAVASLNRQIEDGFVIGSLCPNCESQNRMRPEPRF